jgi:hypothetical protein
VKRWMASENFWLFSLRGKNSGSNESVEFFQSHQARWPHL